MRIKSVAAHPKRGGQHRITMEDGRAITVSEGALTAFYLYPGKEIEETELEALMEADGRQKVRDRAMRLLDYRAMSRKELFNKLVEKGEDREQAEEAADWLVEIGQIDDAEHAGRILRHYAGKGYGRKRIEQELRRRGIEKEHWDIAFMEMPEESGSAVDQFIQSKLRGEMPDRKEEKRVTDALLRRGYSWDEAGAALRRYKESLEE